MPMLLRLMQPAKAPLSKLVTVLGIITFVRAVQWSNARMPML
jgi:hypothetical protein